MEKKKEKYPYYQKYKFILIGPGGNQIPPTNFIENIIYKFQRQCELIGELTEIIIDHEEAHDDLEYPLEIPLKIEMVVPLLSNREKVSTFTGDDNYTSIYEDFIGIILKNPTLIIQNKHSRWGIFLRASLRNFAGKDEECDLFLGSSNEIGVVSANINTPLRADYRTFILEAIKEYFSNP